jgi:hypothetical protein
MAANDEDLSLEEVRGRADVVLDRARSDADFRQRLRSDPRRTLSDAGIPEGALADLGMELHVIPFDRCNYTCDRYSCIVTWCGYIPLSN